MENIRVCVRCGPQSIGLFYAFKTTNRHGNREKVRYNCKKCWKDKRKKQYQDDPHKNNEQVNKWRQANKDRAREIVKSSYEKNKDSFLTEAKKIRAQHKLEAILHYSPECKCQICPESNLLFLVIDHTEGGGTKHRKEVGGGDKFYDWLRKNSYPEGYRVLCNNCNFKYGKRTQPEPKERQISTKESGYNKKYLDLHPEKRQQFAKSKRLKRQEIKRKVFEHYGMSCNCCGHSDFEVLSLDHVHGGGRAHRRELGLEGNTFLAWIIRNEFPEGFQTLCLNCNFAKKNGRECPHKSGNDH